MRIKVLAIAVLCLTAPAWSQFAFPPAAGGGVGVGASNPFTTVAGTSTTMSVNISSLNLTSVATAIMSCKTATTTLAFTYTTTGSAPITAVNFTYASTAGVTCTVNSNGGAGAAGPTGPVGPSGATGPAGSTGPAGPLGSSVAHTFAAASTSGSFLHNLGYASHVVQCINASGYEVLATSVTKGANTDSFTWAGGLSADTTCTFSTGGTADRIPAVTEDATNVTSAKPLVVGGGVFANGTQEIVAGVPTSTCSWGAMAYQIDAATGQNLWMCNGYYWTNVATGTASYVDANFDWYVDSVAGSDSNTGRTAAQAYKTIGQLLATVTAPNLARQSEAMASGDPWVVTRSTAASATGPDGLSTGIKLTEDSTATQTHFLLLNHSIAAGTYTISVYAKAGERTKFALYAYGSSKGVGFDLSAGTTFTATGFSLPTTYGIQSVGSGWYRCYVVTTPAVTTSPFGAFFLVSGANPTYSGDGTSGLYFAHPEINTGSSPLVYTATGASTTISKVSAGQKVGLKAGSKWREQFTVPNANVTVAAYGTGAKPILDASDVISTGAWSKTGGQTSVYQASLTIATDALNRISVWEDSVRLRKVASIAAVDATAGTYFPSAEATSPITLYIHATGNGNPASNGKNYEYASRLHAITSLGVSGARIFGIQAQRNLHDNGPMELDRYSFVKDCLIKEGTKHNLYVRGGSTVVNTELADLYDYFENTSLFVFYDPVVSSLGINLFNVYAHADMVPDAGRANDGYLSHSVSPTGISLGPILAVNVRADNVGTAFGWAAMSAVTMSGCTSVNASVNAMLIDASNAAPYVIRNCSFGVAATGARYFLSTSAFTTGEITSNTNTFSGAVSPLWYVNGVDYNFADWQALTGQDTRSASN